VSSIAKIVWGGSESIWYWHAIGLLAGVWIGVLAGSDFAQQLQRNANRLIGTIAASVAFVTSIVLGFWAGALMGGWMLLAILISGIVGWRLPVASPENSPLDLPMLSLSIARAFGTEVRNLLVNLRSAITMLSTLTGAVIGGLLWENTMAVVIGAVTLGIVGRLLSFGIVLIASQLADRKLRMP